MLFVDLNYNFECDWFVELSDNNLGPVVRSLVSANRWLRGIKTYRFPWYLTLVSANHASSNPGLSDNKLSDNNLASELMGNKSFLNQSQLRKL